MMQNPKMRNLQELIEAASRQSDGVPYDLRAPELELWITHKYPPLTQKENTGMTRTLEELKEAARNTPPGTVVPMSQEEFSIWLKYMEQFTFDTTKPSSIHEVLAERGSRYGPFAGHATITQDIKAAMRGIDVVTNWEKLNYSQREALEMIAHKIGRILNGDPNYPDSWVDIVGYTQLVVDELNAANAKEKQNG